MKRLVIVAIVVLAVIILFSGFAYVVDETKQVVITRFGKPVREPVKDAGLHFKIPFIEDANFFNKNLLEWDGDPGQMPTKDKTFIWVDTFARWKISNPLTFFETVGNEMSGQSKLDNIIESATRNLITSHHLIEAVRNSNRKLDISQIGVGETIKEIVIKPIEIGREKLSGAIMDQAKPKLAEFGIELVDVRIKRINYVEEVQKAVYNRMIAERKQIAEKFRSEGRGESSKIAGDKAKELKKITSVAYRKAQEIKGKADAESTKIYAEAYNKDPEFYSFINTMEIYKNSL
ncbi:MAG: protease modulator HflC, partial [Deltaproteobacteria bacterium]|nr:protease modulator HflC [Deltaproteobacteria bacterium]